jgi:hypothetical protein
MFVIHAVHHATSCSNKYSCKKSSQHQREMGLLPKPFQSPEGLGLGFGTCDHRPVGVSLWPNKTKSKLSVKAECAC